MHLRRIKPLSAVILADLSASGGLKYKIMILYIFCENMGHKIISCFRQQHSKQQATSEK